MIDALATSTDDRATRLVEIRKRVDATTPGPWILDDHAPYCPVIWTGYEAALGGEIAEYLEHRGFIKAGDEYPRGDNHPTENMTFMAHARQDVPWLLETVDADAALIKLQSRRIVALTAELERLAACEPAHRMRIAALLHGEAGS